MTALALMTGGMVSPPWVAMQKCLADRGIKHIYAKATVTPTVQARVQMQDHPLVSEPLFPPVPPKPMIRAAVPSAASAVITKKATAPAPPGPTPPSPTTPDKPQVRVKKNGNGNGKPKIRGPKT